jgi:hypothetical protein
MRRQLAAYFSSNLGFDRGFRGEETGSLTKIASTVQWPVSKIQKIALAKVG